MLHRLAADGPDPDLCRGLRLFRGRSPEVVRAHRHQRDAVPRSADRAAAAHWRPAALCSAGADPGVQAARPDGDTRYMSADATQRAAQGATLVAAPGFGALARRHWPWLAAIVAALLLPWLFFDWSTHRHSGFALTMLSEIGLMSVFALSFNMQMGQAGPLSFGHAILFGLGGYCAAPTLNAVKAGAVGRSRGGGPLAGRAGGGLSRR